MKVRPEARGTQEEVRMPPVEMANVRTKKVSTGCRLIKESLEPEIIVAISRTLCVGW